ncbi:cutinase family protein [Nocardia sp. NBC_01327]|uniref:cutinase family protein n=1 Tax=Nocardia sp. NBC_01327 TaxID=2903593 RepID=UPI002E152836|nr:cutinase family protein [Nocardia sp. NBC_01327]
MSGSTKRLGRTRSAATSRSCASLGLLVAGALTLAATAVPGTAMADSSAPNQSASGCPSVAGVFLPGTWETHTGADETQAVGLFAPVATALAQQFGAQFEYRFPAYAAEAFDGMAYSDSKATGVAAVRRVVGDIAGACPATKFVLAGYSQGADAMGDVAASIGCNGDPLAADRVLGVGLVADPKQGTAGGKLIGPTVDGQGIAGTRASGFCALSAVTAEICAPKDKYCATNSSEDPITAGIGRALTQSGDSTGTGSGGTSQQDDLGQALSTDLSADKIADLPATITRLGTQATTGADSSALTKTASDVAKTLQPLSDLSTWVSSTPDAQKRLSDASDGSADKLAGSVLDGVRRSDVSKAMDALSDLGTQSDKADSGTARAQDAQTAANAVAPLTDSLSSSTSTTASQAAQVLAVLKPSVVVNQLVNVVSNGISFAQNVPTVADTLGRMIGLLADPGIDTAGKVNGLHDMFGQLNNLFEPLVKMAAGVDLHTASRLIAMIPDTTGTAQIVSVIVGVLANLDVVALAQQVGQLQDKVWALAQTISSGGDLLAVGARLLDFVPTALGFATLALNTLTGQTTSSQGSQNTTDLSGLAKSLTTKTDANSTTKTDANSNDGLDAISKLLSEGSDAMSFLLSGVHESYDHYVVDSDGRTAVQWLSDWFSNRIRHVVGVV